jgi:hypothetical protein
MERSDRVVELATGGLVGIGAVLADSAYHEQKSGPRNWLFFASYLCFILAILIPLAYFGIHPLMVRLNRWRFEFVAGQRDRRASVERLRVESQTRSSSGVFELIDARYVPKGESHVMGGVVVTDIVASKIVDGHLDMLVSNEELGGDPGPNVPKELVVEWRRDVRKFITTFDEGNRATLP